MFLINDEPGLGVIVINRIRDKTEQKTVRGIMSIIRRKALRSSSLDDRSAAEVIQAWYKGNFSRERLESSRVERNVKSGLDGASLYKKSSRVRKRSMTLPQVGRILKFTPKPTYISLSPYLSPYLIFRTWF